MIVRLHLAETLGVLDVPGESLVAEQLMATTVFNSSETTKETRTEST